MCTAIEAGGRGVGRGEGAGGREEEMEEIALYRGVYYAGGTCIV